MRALAHPARLEALEILQDQGPMTATELSEHIGESPANTAFHLRTLAKYGFIEDAGGGTGRARPWKTSTRPLFVKEEELSGETRRAATTMVGALRASMFRRIERWANERAGYPKKWQAAGFEIEFGTYMTADELAKAGKAISGVLGQYKHSSADAPKGAQKVMIAAWGFPRVPPDNI
jgi:DNA-binding transcriptional ArsR family regulator